MTETNTKYFLAIDVGASSGRHIVGWKENGEIKTKEVYRFPNGNKQEDGHLIWEIEALVENIKLGVKEAFAAFPVIESLAIDTWGVDYVLLDKDGKEILPMYAYRDSRTELSIPEVHKLVPEAEIFSRTGIQFNTFNTIYQLYHDKMTGRLDKAADLLMLPEYLSYKLTGVKKHEYTETTTGALVNAKTGKFDTEIIERLGFPTHLFGELSAPGTFVGKLSDDVASFVGGQTNVLLCASHDTASAVEAIEMENEDSLYISSGTWSLLGIKLPEAVCDEQSRLSGYSNEGGVGYTRYQKNIMGMWTVQSLRRELCPEKDFITIEKEATTSDFTLTTDINHPSFLAPVSMKGAFDEAFKDSDVKPVKECDYFSCAHRSLAECYRVAIEDVQKNLGKKFTDLYIVGGGAKNKFLNELTAKACGINVIPLPIEASSIGNLLVQMKNCK